MAAPCLAVRTAADDSETMKQGVVIVDIVNAEHDKDGNLLAYADGGYPLVYYTADGAELCADCATDFLSDPDAWNPEQCTVTQFDVFYEGAPITCEHCYKTIESAYGDPGASQE